MDKANKKTDKLITAMEARIQRIYRCAGDEIDKKAKEYFIKFEEMDSKNRKLVEDGTWTEDDYQNWRLNKILYGERFKQIKDDFAQRYLQANKTAVQYVNNRLPEIYAENYNNAGKQLEQAIKGYSYTMADEQTIKNLATKSKTLLPYKIVDGKKDIRWNTKKINGEVLQGILQGESMPKIAKRLQNVTEMNKNSAIRNARTSVNGAENKARLDRYYELREKGIIIKKKWSAAQDKRTRHSHKKVDGEIKELEEMFSNGCMYPGDPNGNPHEVYNCRCSLVSKIEGFSKMQNPKSAEIEGMSADTYTVKIRDDDKAKSIARDLAYGLTSGAKQLINGRGDTLSAYINNVIGYDGLPKVVSNNEFSILKEKGRVIYRGIASNATLTVQQMEKNLKYGDFFIGKGIYGSGTYCTYTKETALNYARNDATGAVIEMIIAEDARIADYAEILREYDKTMRMALRTGVKNRELWQSIIGDIGKYASIKGYDAIAVNEYQKGHDYIVVLNRTKIILKE